MATKKTRIERLIDVVKLISLIVGIPAAIVALVVAVITNWTALTTAARVIWDFLSGAEWLLVVGLILVAVFIGIAGALVYRNLAARNFRFLFVGRKDQVLIFRRLLKDIGRDVNCLCVYGFAGVGKSALLRQFEREAKKRHLHVIHGSIRGSSFVSFAAFTAKVETQQIASIGSEPERAAADALLRSIRFRTVVLIDDYPETDELDETMRWLAEEAQRRRNRILFVIASRREPPFADFRPFQGMKLEGLSKSEVEELIERSIKERPFWIRETSAYAERLYEQTQGNPKLIEIICVNQRTWDHFKKSPEIRLFTIHEIERSVLTEVWESLSDRLHESTKVLATLSRFSPVLRGDKCARLVDYWAEVKDVLLSRAILLASNLDSYTMHDLFRDYAYEKHITLEERREIHRSIAKVYEANESADLLILALRHFTAAQHVPGIKRIYPSAIERMTLLGDYKGATELIKQIATFLDQEAEPEFFGIVMKDLGFASSIMGEYGVSLESFDKAKIIFSRRKMHSELASVLRGTADTYRLVGQFEDALHSYRESQLEFEHTDDKSGVAYSLIGMAKVLKIQGYYADALKSYRRAHDVLVASEGSDVDIAWAVFGEAELLRLMGRYKQAREIYRYAYDVFAQADHAEGLGYALWGTGEIHRLMGEYDDAVRDHSEALKIFKRIRDRRCIGWAMLGLGETMRVSKRYDDALEQYLRAREHWRIIGNTAEEPHAMLGLAETRRLMGTADIQLFDDTLSVYRSKRVQSGIVHTLIGRALASLDNWELAIQDLREAEHIAYLREFEPELALIQRIYKERNPYEVHPLNFP
jgi:tetratricopeptide (TPR) repeat protein